MTATDHKQRLDALRRQLADLNCDGFVLPRTDRFGSEYLPAADERVAWLTGFTGSAARVVVLAGDAALFTDGRYTLQAESEVDGNLFERLHITDKPPAEWLGSKLSKDHRLGYDPYLHLKSDVERLQKLAKDAGAELVALDRNPIDSLWTDRPPSPSAPITVHDVDYAGETSASKRSRMLAKVHDKHADGLLLTASDSIAWLLNIRGNDIPFNPLCLALCVLEPDGGALLLLEPAKVPDGFPFEPQIRTHPIDDRASLLKSFAARQERLLVDPKQTHLGWLLELEQAGVPLVEGDEPVYPAKAIKNQVEIDGSIRAHIRDGAAVSRFLAWLDGQDRTNELEAARQLQAERQKDPTYRGDSFDTISGVGAHGALIHYRVTDKSNCELEPGSLYLVDSGGQYPDATTDITRTVAVGEPDAEMRRRFTLVLKGHIALATTVFPKGTSGSQLDAIARMPLWVAGFDFDHGTGHGIGSYLCVHEGPQRISKRGGDSALEPGMILSNEPGYYKAGAYGIRIENLVLVEERAAPPDGERDLLGFKTLSLAPIDRRLIDVTMLDEDERDWVDAYHGAVFRKLADHMNDAETAWLEAATAPLAVD
ncbi:MAG: aminopeptidase P family protein [Geminicoccaceae bacterium]